MGWDRRFLDLAKLVASWSKDPSTQTGAVIVRPDRSIVSLGFNGFPRGMDDNPERYANREEKYSRIVHCEMNALLNAREPLLGYTIYIYPLMSCDRCAVHLVQAGIRRVVAPELKEHLKERWGATLEKSVGYLRECGVVAEPVPYE